MRTGAMALALALLAGGGALPACAAGNGSVTVALENDVFSGSDNNYTNGLGITWVSGAIGRDDPGPLGRWTRFWSFLPLVGDDRYATYASFALAHEMNTPDDITMPEPSQSDQPYSGILSLDSLLYVQQRDWTHAWQLKLGIVGPAAKAGPIQRRLHRLIGADEPMGWHTQLPNEPIVNVGYSVAHRAASGTLGQSVEWRVVPVGTVGVGNYFTGAGLGVYGEFGWNLVDALGVTALRSGLNAASTVGVGRMDRWSVSIFAGVGAYAVAHYLPLDGTVFRQSRSVEAGHRMTLNSAGFCLRRDDLTVSFSWTRFPNVFDTERKGTDFGTMSLSWLL
jgi:lipid A 3-O-deacylase